MTDAEQKAFAQGRAAGLEEAAKQIWIECVAAADDNDLRIYTLLSELRKSILRLSPTSSDAGKDDAQIVEQTSCQECGGRRIVLRHVNSHRDDTEPCQKCAALSSLEVIGKGEKG